MDRRKRIIPAAGKGTLEVPASVKSAEEKKQPPLVVKNKLFKNLQRILSSCTVKPSYKLARFDIKVICSTAESFDTVREHLTKNSVEFFTHQRPHRVVIRGLPRTKPEKVKQLLKELHNVEVFDIGRKDESTPVVETPYVVFFFSKWYTNLNELRQIKQIRATSIRWETYGHGTKNCHLKVRCSSCGSTHDSDECQLQDAQAKKCANCSGPHGAMDRSCRIHQLPEAED